ncbi:hypothetical protein [Bradyrhizobium sp. ORS 86]|uniref:hypothetical protein n=1 Tax=Bradyrhizobium sp. ORS 86 TaxID=1685970 RepID=UPI00388D3260
MAKIMHALKISEISAVDRPAQAHAKAVIMKRADVRKDMYQVSRFADLLSSLAYLMQSSEYEAAAEKDGSVVPASLRAWLKTGAQIFQSMAAEELDELLSTVAKRDAEEPYWKRDFSDKQRKELAESGAAESDGSYPISNASDLKNAMRAYGRSKDKAKTKAHIRARAKALGLESELTPTFKRDDTTVSLDIDPKPLLAKLEEIQKALAAGNAVTPNGDPDMDPEIAKALGLDANAKTADVLGVIAKMVTELKTATSELAIAKAQMSDEEKAYHDALKSDEEKASFRALSKGERTVKMAKRDDLPEYVRKQLAEAEDVKKRLAALEQKDETETIAKRVADVGMGADQVEVVRKAYKGDKGAVDAILDVVKGLVAQVKAAGLFKELGDGRDGGGAGNDAYAQLVAKAEELRKKDPNLTKEQAFAKVYQDPANADLAKRERGENRPHAA